MIRVNATLLVSALALSALLLSPTAVGAENTVIKLSNLQATGWVLATQQGGTSAKGEFVTGPGTPPAGAGSVLLSVGNGATDPGPAWSDPLPKVYLGTNSLSGVRLDRITRFTLWVCPVRWTWAGAQPVTAELAIGKGSEMRLCTFKPWGFQPTGFYGKMTWQEIDLLGAGGAWEVTNTDSKLRRGDWAWLRAVNPSAGVVTPPAADWPFGTVSGTGLSIKIGSGKAAGSFRKGNQWWKESDGCCAYVDKLTLGYRDDAGAEIVKTFDFESD